MDWKHFRCELGRWISKVSDLKCQRSSTARFASQWTKLKNSSLKTHFSISRAGDWKPETISQPLDQSLWSPRQKKSHCLSAVWCYSQCLISNSNWQWLLIAGVSNNEPPPAVLQSSQHEAILQGICFISASLHFSGATPANDCGELPSAVWRSVLTSEFKQSFDLLRKPVKESPIKALGNKTAVIDAQSVYNPVRHKLCKHRAKNVPQSENTWRSVRVFISENTFPKKSLHKLKSWPCGCLTDIH